MHLHLASLIQQHGYWISFVGSMLEGEAVLTIAGLAAHRGYLHAPALVALGASGSFIGDQIFFMVGRRFGVKLFRRFPRLRQASHRVNGVVLRFSALSVIVVRFLYGLRLIGPIVIGMGSMPWRTFALYNAIGAIIWATCWVCVGYLLGDVAQMFLGDLRHIETWLFVAVILVAISTAVFLHFRRRGAAVRSDNSRV